MILYLDVRRDRAVLAAVDPGANGAKAAKWLELVGDNKIGAALTKARGKFGFARKHPTVVVLAMNAPGITQVQRNVTWSGVRQGVATANALAFAWGVPACALLVRGDESREELPALVRAAATKATPGGTVAATYDGEPNITKPKK